MFLFNHSSSKSFPLSQWALNCLSEVLEELFERPLLLWVVSTDLVDLRLHLVHYLVSVGFLFSEELVVQVISSSIGGC